MINDSLTFLATELNKYFNQRLGQTTDPRVVLGNITKVADGDGSNTLLNKVVITVINVEEDKVSKVREGYIKINGGVSYKKPPIYINVYILIAINLTSYPDSLKFLNYVMQFFQSHPSFDTFKYPDLNPKIEQLNLDLFSLNFEQINHIWSTMGGKYLPSVMYKIRQLTVEDEIGEVTEGSLIETVISNVNSIYK